MGHDYSSFTHTSSKYLPCPLLLFYVAKPLPILLTRQGKMVPRRRSQLQCCICVAGVLCCSLSFSSWLKPGTGKDTEKWLLQTAVTAFSWEHLRIPYLCPFSFLYHPTAEWNEDTSFCTVLDCCRLWESAVWLRVVTRSRHVTTLPCILWSYQD